METKKTSLPARWARFIAVCSISTSLLAACKADTPVNDLGVSIHGVNYSEQDFSYVVEDPNDSANTGGGEAIGRYEAGGTMCCYSLPKKWHAGLQVKVESTYWLPKTADGNLPEFHESHQVDIPEYPKPGDIWVLRGADGKPTIVVSELQPDHPDWPGKIKGWPVPSIAYRHERWALLIHLAEEDVAADESLVRELAANPNERATESWDNYLKHMPGKLQGFEGAQDPRFREQLRLDDKNRLSESKNRLVELRSQEP